MAFSNQKHIVTSSVALNVICLIWYIYNVQSGRSVYEEIYFSDISVLGHKETVDILLKAKANLNLKNGDK